ncbi:MAG: hypothetical protein KTR16_16625 [Acidiferrobacterales bacterium]|nr:hypothetical protein [Acidiferrobacterales bacterium]
MSEAKFTKGEWVASEGLGGGAIVYIPNGGFDISEIPDAIFNAHLFASANKMYEFIETHMGGHPEAEALLAKARGES